MKFQKTEAIVLRKTNFSDHHKIVTLFTRDFGKVQAVARGVRKIKSKMSPHLEMGTHLSCTLIEGKGLKTLSSVRSISNNKTIRTDLSKTAELYLMCEAINKLTNDEYFEYELFDIFRESIFHLEKSSRYHTHKLVSCAFLLKLLSISGYKPELYSCVVSGEKINECDHFFSVEKGGLIKSVNNYQNVYKITAKEIKILRYLINEKLQKIVRVNLENGLIEGIQRTLNVYVQYLLSQPIQSHRFIEKIRIMTV